MDLNSIKSQVSNLTLYDLKAGVRKVQNAVMNYTEMESKVREATNNEPWGASSSLMQEIASGTHSFHLLQEIMPMIYKRFTEKAAEEWRQIYKLLEFLVKNGSERVIDDARSHLSLLKMLRQFHYIDQNGKDQGINVRNRSKELAELLSDVDRIRAERKKARANRSKFGGVEGGAGLGGASSAGRYGGFGSENAGYGGYSGGVYGDGGGFGGQTSDYQDTSSRRDQFEEYDEYDEDGGSTTIRRKPASNAPPNSSLSTNQAAASSRKLAAKKSEPAKPKEPEIDFLSFDDGEPATVSGPSAADNATNNQSSSLHDLSSVHSPASTALPGATADDDDFDEFESAAPPTTTSTSNGFSHINVLSSMSSPSSALASPPLQPSMTSSRPVGPNYNISMTSTPPPQPQAVSKVTTKPSAPSVASSGYQPTAPNYFTSIQAPQAGSTQPSTDSKASSITTANMHPGATGSNPSTVSNAAKSKGGDAFGSLWSTASSSAGIKKSAPDGSQGPNLAALQREKATQGIWAHSAASTSNNVSRTTLSPAPASNAMAHSSAAGGSNGLDDLLG